ncbi:uncharacterized protein LOC143305763 [Osmia lignaria lignaria]|uniref:uncharacterized protein LOC143305763 n=1 Tax=Osmia lignaria lignaria TaxID=1437193 RepID=UPI00402BCC52
MLFSDNLRANSFRASRAQFRISKQQVERLRVMYQLDDCASSTMIMLRLRGKGLKWFHSKPSLMELSATALLEEMRKMFEVRLDKLAARREFEKRTWQKTESFCDYFHDKVTLANRILIDPEELVDLVIDGVPDPRLRDQARMQRLETASDLLEAFRKLSLRDEVSSDREGLQKTSTGMGILLQMRSSASRKELPEKYPHGGPGAKAATGTVVDIDINIDSDAGNFCKFAITAMIDSGSSVSLIKYGLLPSALRLDSPKLNNYYGINHSRLDILGVFSTMANINDMRLEIKFFVVLDNTMSCFALLGRDFISSRSVRITMGDAFEIATSSNKDHELETKNFAGQILQIDYVETPITVTENLNIDPNLDSKTAKELRQIYLDIQNHPIDNNEPPCSVEAVIALKTEQPVSFRPRRLAFADKEKLRIILDDLLKQGIIRLSNSPYASPIVMVRKKNGEIRLCVDFREINKLTIRDNFPVPLIDDYLDQLRDKQYFTKLDLKDAFHHVRVSENSVKYTSFITPLGQYEYLKMPFGLTNAPQLETAEFLIDGGAAVNLIVRDVLGDQAKRITKEVIEITGLTKSPIYSIGTTILHIHGKPALFYVVENLAIEADGIIGSPFLLQEEAEISYYHGTLVLKDKPIRPLRFSNYRDLAQQKNPKSTKHRIEARTTKQIAIHIANPNIKEGYLPRLKTSENIYIGEAAVYNRDGICYALATNTGEDDVDIEIEPQYIHPYDIYDSSDDDPISSYMTENTPENRATRIRNLLRTDHLNAEERKHVFNIVDEFSDRFYLPGDKLGEVPNFYHSIHTTDDVPINTRQYRYPPVHQDEIQRQVKALLLQGVIQPSSSPYNSPLWIVPKKPDAKGNKRWRMVIDFRALNEKTLSDKFPLPNITEILDKLGGAKYFTIFDIANGFHQVQMDPKDCPKTAFTTPDGHFEFVRMPFGLKNAPPTFQRLMNQVISGLENAHVFIDDMVVFSSSLREHEIKVKKLLNRLREFGLTLQIDKCEFLRKEVTYLGHILTENGVKPDPRKLQAVKEFPIPKTQKNVQQFLGLTGYYRRFIKDYSIKSKPLVQLLGKGIRFKWTEDQQKSFENLRDELCTQPILQYPDFNRPFIVTTDASDYAIGAVLSQGEIGNDLPIAYASRTLNKAERNYSATEKECLAMVYAVQYFRPYLYGTKFTLVTDHRPLVWLHSVKDPTSRLMKWRLRLLEYEYQVIHKAGKTNKNADALSRNPVPSCLPLIPRDPQDPDYKHIGQKPEIDTDSIGFRVRQLQRDRERRPKYQEENTSSDEEPARGKVQHSPIADRPRVLPNLSHEISMPDEHMETINFHPQANSTKITSTEEDRLGPQEQTVRSNGSTVL